MAVKKVGGSTRNGRDSAGRRLGLKRNHGQFVKTSSIILRQRGKKFKCGQYTYYGKDQTIHASCDGVINFERKSGVVYVKIVTPV